MECGAGGEAEVEDETGKQMWSFSPKKKKKKDLHVRPDVLQPD